MEITTKSRSELKLYFKRNNVPTEQQFADLIDAMLNQKDDGISKLAENPLSIAASRGESGQKPAINFYGSAADQKPAWVLSLNTRSDPQDPNTDRSSFIISDGKGTPRLCIDHQTGHVGIGTAQPQDPLEVYGRASLGMGIANSHFPWRGNGWAYISGKGIIFREDAAGRYQERMRIADNGNVGIGTTNPEDRLEVHGRASLGMGIANSHFPWRGNGWAYISGKGIIFREDAAGGYQERMRIADNGNVGIGTTNPQKKLDVTGTIRTRKLQLGDKWILSGVGDQHANDDWLRLFDVARDGSNVRTANYRGGFAAGRLWCSNAKVESDARVKTDVTRLENAIDRIRSLRGVRFKRKDREAESCDIGLIAQEVESVYPELVEIGPHGMKGINYSGLVAPLIEAVKEQQTVIEDLRLQVREQREKTQQLHRDFVANGKT